MPLARSAARGFGLRSAPVGAKRVPLARGGLRSAPVGAKRVPLARSTISRFFFCVFQEAVALVRQPLMLSGGGHQSSKRRFMTAGWYRRQ